MYYSARHFKAKINAYACTFNVNQSYLLLMELAGTSPNISNEPKIQHFLLNELTICKSKKTFDKGPGILHDISQHATDNFPP